MCWHVGEKDNDDNADNSVRDDHDDDVNANEDGIFDADNNAIDDADNDGTTMTIIVMLLMMRMALTKSKVIPGLDLYNYPVCWRINYASAAADGDVDNYHDDDMCQGCIWSMSVKDPASLTQLLDVHNGQFIGIGALAGSSNVTVVSCLHTSVAYILQYIIIFTIKIIACFCWYFVW